MNIWQKEYKKEVKYSKEKKGTYGAYCEKLSPITPFLIADLIAEEGINMKNGMHVPYQDSENNWTIGFGNTVLKNNQNVTANTPPIRTEEAYELARYHLENGETYFFMYCYDVYFKTININTTGEALALGSIMYNSGTNLIEDKEDKNVKERNECLRKLFKEKGFDINNPDVWYTQDFCDYTFEYFETIHNYINMKDKILRKGSISAYKDEIVLIPMNMRDGCIIARGKSNPDYNYSAPHGAGRLMSRGEAIKTLSTDEFKKSMEGIYSSTVNDSTLDESPFVYKPMESILENIKDTVDVIEIIKPVYNFKAAE